MCLPEAYHSVYTHSDSERQPTLSQVRQRIIHRNYVFGFGPLTKYYYGKVKGHLGNVRVDYIHALSFVHLSVEDES